MKLLRAWFALALMVTLTSTVALTSGAPVQAQPAATLTLSSMSIETSAAGQTVDLLVTVAGPMNAWRLQTTAATTPVATRSGLNQAILTGTVRNFAGTGVLAENQTRSVRMRIPLGRVPAGAYPARVELLSGRKVLASIDFFAVVMRSQSAAPTPVTWIWPITDRPHRGVDGVFLDESLGLSLAPGGRLDLLVRRGSGESVVWAIDPALLAAVTDMSDGYRVLIDDVAVEREASADAAAWLVALREATVARDVIVLPYGDPDLHTLSQLDPIRVTSAREAGVSLAAQVLDRSPATLITDLAWPTGGRLGPDLAEALSTSGYTEIMSTSRSLPAPVGATFTPTALPTQSGVVIADAVLAEWSSARDLSEASRALAELATITIERPAQPRHQVLLPPRIWNPSPAALELMLEQLRPQLRDWQALLAAPRQPRGPVVMSATAYSDSHVQTVEQNWRDIAAVESVLAQPLDAADLLALGAVNAALREYTPPGFLALMRKSSRGVVNGVRVLPGRYTLTAKEQPVSVTVVNDFDVPARVFVVIEPHAPRIQAEQTEAVEVPPRGRTQVLVPITAVATGLVAADAHLLTSAGVAYGDGQVLTFDVRSIGPVANWILLTSTGLLALAVALRLTRRIRQVRRQKSG